MITGKSLPHPIPYQGSKRALTHKILPLFPKEKVRLYEPFAGSAAVSLAAIANAKAKNIVLNDANAPLMFLWKRIIEEPKDLLLTYIHLWNAQLGDERQFYNQIREEFNRTHNPDLLLYLLARCIKASVRYNANGEFNQSPDNRRKGAKPETMAKHIFGASRLLRGRTLIQYGDFHNSIASATPKDVIYMDPPYQGVCGRRDNRYLQSLTFEKFLAVLEEMNRKQLSFIISYDGRTGNKCHGEVLPEDLDLFHIEIKAGASSQATLLGRREETVESLYVSRALVKRIGMNYIKEIQKVKLAQLSLF